MACRATRALPIWLCLIGALSLASGARAQSDSQNQASLLDEPDEASVLDEFAGLSLEDLLDVEVQSVSRRRERVFDAPAAVHVLTAADLRRSGVASIPEALRLVPGLYAGQVNGSQWSVASRGYGGLFANKLLVLIDGRSIYTRLFAGVYWQEEHLAIDDIERIEVIRGPGATLWGANAVNGVINIVTKSSRSDPGARISTRVGRSGEQEHTLRYSQRVGSGLSYRVTGLMKGAGELDGPDGLSADGNNRQYRGSVRADWDRGRDRFTLFSDYYALDFDQTVTRALTAFPFLVRETEPHSYRGGFVQGCWSRALSSGSELSMQSYYDHAGRNSAQLPHTERTFDVELQHDLRVGSRQRVVWGLGFRAVTVASEDAPLISLIPATVSERALSAFVQDEITLKSDVAFLTLGAKFERNASSDRSTWAVQPKVSVAVSPTQRQTLWASASKAVRLPSFVDHHMRFFYAFAPDPLGGPSTQFFIVGDAGFEPEKLTSWEAGYRVRLTSSVSVETALFWNEYSNVGTYEPRTPSFSPTPAPGLVTVDIGTDNNATAQAKGGELLVRLEPRRGWVLEGSYAYFRIDVTNSAESLDVSAAAAEGNHPKHQLRVRSLAALPASLELDVSVRYTSRLRAAGVKQRAGVDARLGWHPGGGLELAMGGRNFFAGSDVEFFPEFRVQPAMIPWSLYSSVSLRF